MAAPASLAIPSLTRRLAATATPHPHPPQVTPAFLDAVAAELPAGGGAVTYMELCEAPSLKPKLGLS